jgi:hypothetical protein
MAKIHTLQTFSIPSFNDEAVGVYTCTVQYGHSTVEGFVNAKIFGKR